MNLSLSRAAASAHSSLDSRFFSQVDLFDLSSLKFSRSIRLLGNNSIPGRGQADVSPEEASFPLPSLSPPFSSPSTFFLSFVSWLPFSPEWLQLCRRRWSHSRAALSLSSWRERERGRVSKRREEWAVKRLHACRPASCSLAGRPAEKSPPFPSTTIRERGC